MSALVTSETGILPMRWKTNRLRLRYGRRCRNRRNDTKIGCGSPLSLTFVGGYRLSPTTRPMIWRRITGDEATSVPSIATILAHSCTRTSSFFPRHCQHLFLRVDARH